MEKPVGITQKLWDDDEPMRELGAAMMRANMDDIVGHVDQQMMGLLLRSKLCEAGWPCSCGEHDASP